jgi:hypothetical protein
MTLMGIMFVRYRYLSVLDNEDRMIFVICDHDAGDSERYNDDSGDEICAL